MTSRAAEPQSNETPSPEVRATEGGGPASTAPTTAKPDPATASSPPPDVAPPVAVRVVSMANAPLLWLVVAVAVLLWLARDVLGPFVIAGVLAYAFSPIVTATQRRTGWRRVAVVGLGYVIALTAAGIVLFLVAGRAINELQLLAASNADSLASVLRQILGSDTVTIGGTTITVDSLAQEIQNALSKFVGSPSSALEVARQVGDVALNVALVIIVTFYLLVDGHGFIDRALSIVPEQRRERMVDLLNRIHVVLGRWLRGELALIGLVAVVVYLILGPILGLRYALAIAVLTGFLEIIPFIGPVIAAAIAAADAFVTGGVGLAVVVIVIYVVLRVVEDQVVTPLVIGRVVHLHPVVTIFAVLVGLSAFGILGGLLGVPAAAAVNVVFNELYRRGATGEAESASTG